MSEVGFMERGVGADVFLAVTEIQLGNIRKGVRYFSLLKAGLFQLRV